MTITISAEDTRSIKAIETAADAGQWLKIHDRDGRKAYRIPSQRKGGLYYLITQTQCTWQDAQRHAGQACKHQLADRLHVELLKEQQARRVVAANAQRYADIFTRFEGD